MEIVGQIGKIPLFENLSEQHRAELASIVSEKEYDKGQSVFLEGDDAVGFYVVVSGQIRVFKMSPEGKEQILHVFGPGEPIGEVAVFAGKHFPANASATKKSKLLFFPRAAFTELIGHDPSMAMNMLAELSRRLRRFTVQIEGLSLKEVPGRLATYLLYLSDEQNGSEELSLDISKGQLASLLGTIPETLSRILAKMAREDIILSTASRTVRIIDQDKLEDLASGELRLS